MLFVNLEPDEAAFGRPVEERAEQVEEGARPKKRGKSLRTATSAEAAVIVRLPRPREIG
jgi:hypothetical protein